MERKLEDILPVTVEHNCILSAVGDITIVFKAEYGEGLTKSDEDYEAMNQGRIRAIKSLPNHSMYTQQDVFRKKIFQTGQSANKSFLGKASDRFFDGRTYLEHECYISITLSPYNRKPASSAFCALLKRSIVPEQTVHSTVLQMWEMQASQFSRLMKEAGIGLRRLNDEDLLSSKNYAGWIERYLFQLPSAGSLLIKDISFGDSVKVGDHICQFFTLSDAENYPAFCSARITHDGYSTDQTSFPVGFGAYAGMLLDTDHIYNQYIAPGDVNETRKRLEKKNRKLYALANYSRENAIAHDGVEEYLDEMLEETKRPCRVHYNVMTIAENEAIAREQVNMVTAAFAQMDAVAKIETVSAAQLYWAGIPGNAADLPQDHMIETFVEQGSCFLSSDSPYRSAQKGNIRLGERINGRPVDTDLFDEPMLKGIITNRNLIVVGGSGGGKSVFVNHLLRSLFDQGCHSVIVDIGGSYKGLCSLVKGYYFTYTQADPIRFNPFYLPEGDAFDTEKRENLKALLVTLWKEESESFLRSEYVALSSAIQGYYEHLKNNPCVFPCFNSFFEWLEKEYIKVLKQQKVKERQFDVDNFLYVLRPFYKGGEFDYLLNATENLDMLHQRFIVFELDNIKDHPILFPVVTLIIMELFISKMRKIQNQRKALVIEEAWKAIAKTGMAEFIKYVYKTVRKYEGIAAVVTQEIDDLISSPVIKDAIINNSDTKVLMDMRKFINRFDDLQAAMGLSDKAKTILLSVNRNNDPGRRYREVFIDQGGQICKVYRNELSPEEYYTYTTEQSEKVKVTEYADKYGSMEAGISVLLNEVKEKH